jgi:DNA (cytosine-5)-methyltransferase 1
MKALDICSGIGGFRIGTELTKNIDIKFDFIANSEIDKYANYAYETMFGKKDEVFLDDIQRITRFEDEFEHEGRLVDSDTRLKQIDDLVPNFDILFSGFPCQPHSLMGNRKGNNDKRGNLFYDLFEVIRAKKPNYFILENVRALKSVNSGLFFSEIKYLLESELGYNLAVLDGLNASDFGVPQTRRRIFIIGSKIKSLKKINIKKVSLQKSKFPTTWHILDKAVDDKYYLSKKIKKTILKHEHKGYKRKAEINLLIARPLTKTMHKMHRASQDNYYSQSFIEGKYHKKKNEVILNQNFDNNMIRRITPKEALLIQSFPKRYVNKLLKSKLSDTRLYMLAGNAVPPKMVSEVLKGVFE